MLERELLAREVARGAPSVTRTCFFKENGEPIRNLQYPWVRWRRSLTVNLKGRYREPYNARHSSVTWNLRTGKNPLWVAKQHGHSVQTMLDVYAAWIEGAKESTWTQFAKPWNQALGPALARALARSRPHQSVPFSPQNLALIWHWNRARMA